MNYNNLSLKKAVKIIKKLKKLLNKKNTANNPNKKILIPETIDLIEKAIEWNNKKTISENDYINDDDLEIYSESSLEENPVFNQIEKDKKIVEKVKKVKSVNDYINFFSNNFNELMNNPKFRSSAVSEAYKRGVVDNEATLKDLFGHPQLSAWEIEHTKQNIERKKQKLENLKGDEEKKQKLEREIDELNQHIITRTENFWKKFFDSVEKFKQSGKLSSISSEIARSKKDIKKKDEKIKELQKKLLDISNPNNTNTQTTEKKEEEEEKEEEKENNEIDNKKYFAYFEKDKKGLISKEKINNYLNLKYKNISEVSEIKLRKGFFKYINNKNNKLFDYESKTIGKYLTSENVKSLAVLYYDLFLNFDSQYIKNIYNVKYLSKHEIVKLANFFMSLAFDGNNEKIDILKKKIEQNNF